MAAKVLGETFLHVFKGLETAGETVFKSKTAAEEAVDALRSNVKRLTHEGRHGQTANELVESIVSRTTVVSRSVGNAENVFRIAIDTGGDGTLAVGSVMRDVRLGRVAELLDKINVPVDSVFRKSSFIDHLTRTLQRSYPDTALENLAKRLRNIRDVPSELFEKSAYESADELRALIVADKNATRLVDAMKKALNKGRPIVTKGLFFSIALTAGSAVGVYAALAESAKRATGCWRIYRDRDTNELLSCRVRYASCSIGTGDGGEGEKFCKRYPRVVRETSCVDEWSHNTPCVHCDPMGSGTDKLEVNDYVDPTDTYVCRSRPSLGEMLGQIVLDAPHVLSEAASDVLEGAESIFIGVWAVVKAIAIWILFGLGFFILMVYLWKRDKEKKAKEDDGEETGSAKSTSANQKPGSI